MARRNETTSFSISRYILFIILCLIAIVAGIWLLTASKQTTYDSAPDAVMTVETVRNTPTNAPSTAQ